MATKATPRGKSRAAAGASSAVLDRDEAIRMRAYYLWEASGREPGRDLEYWLIAEQELREQEPSVRSK